MKEIIFKYPFPQNLSKETLDELKEKLAQFLVNLVNCETIPEHKVFFKKDSGYEFQIGVTNDWFFGIDNKEANTFKLVHRYGYSDKVMNAIKTIIIWRLGIERHNDVDIENG